MQPLENIIKIPLSSPSSFIHLLHFTFTAFYFLSWLQKIRLINYLKKYWAQVLNFEGKEVLGSHFGTSRVSQVSVLQSEGGNSVQAQESDSHFLTMLFFFSLPSGNIGKLKIINYDCNHRLERNRFLWLGCRL